MPRIKKVLSASLGTRLKVRLVEAEIADPAAGQVQVQVKYSTFSGTHINMRRGMYPFQKKAPLTPGYTVVGTVRLNGSGCRKFKPGDLVACVSIYTCPFTMGGPSSPICRSAFWWRCRTAWIDPLGYKSFGESFSLLKRSGILVG